MLTAVVCLGRNRPQIRTASAIRSQASGVRRRPPRTGTAVAHRYHLAVRIRAHRPEPGHFGQGSITRPNPRQGQHQCQSGRRGVEAAPAAARIERTPAARHRLNATARSNAACRTRISPISLDSLVTPAAAAPVKNASPTGPNPRNALCLGSGTCGPTWPVRARAAVVVIDNAGLTRRDQGGFGEDLPGDRFDDAQRPVLDQHRDRLGDQPVRHRVATRSEPDAGELVDLPGRRP